MSCGEVDHYGARFWNHLPAVLAYMCKRATGNPRLWWMDYVKQRYADPPFTRGLVIGCGNGWVERDLYDRGVARHFDAFDASPRYIETANAQKGDRSITYRVGDYETFRPNGKYDLIVNVAALHHACYLYRLVSRLADALEPHGLFVNWDYVGPSRNQYNADHERIMVQINESLPERFRTPHRLRPLIFETIADPTEAVHAADIMPAVEKCFEIVERRDLGGGVAYQLLWQHTELFEGEDPEAKQVLERILLLDDELTRAGTVPSLFSFFVCRRRDVNNVMDLRRRVYEPLRESFAKVAGGYYPSEIPILIRDKYRVGGLAHVVRAGLRKVARRFARH